MGDALNTVDTETEAPQGEPADPGRKRRRGWRRLRTIAWSLVVVLIVIVSSAGLYVTWAVRHSFPTVEGTLAVPGLTGPAEVLRDGYGVPQIYADNPHDLFLAQGYTHAQDRFWEMDVRRHITSGRLSELFGESQVVTDSTVRTMGWRQVAEQELPLLSQRTRDYLQAYADGVNAYLAEHSGTGLSLEYTVLGVINSGYTPAPWTPADSVAWLKAMAWDLNGTVTDQARHAMLAAVMPPETIRQLYPDYDFQRWEPTVQPGETSRDPKPVGGGSTAPSSADPGTGDMAGALRDAAEASTALDDVLGPRGEGIGSNGWVVSGKLTASGKPMLANDPHLAPQMPSLWYQNGLHCRSVGKDCPFDVSGFGFSGMPGVIIGHNADISWGLTNLGPADTDLYLERVTDGDYEYQGRKVPLQTRQEVIKVAGGKDRVITVRSTGHGPILSDVVDRLKSAGQSGRSPGADPVGGGYAVAIKWTALQPARTLDAVFELDAARDWHTFRQAASKFAAPAQNMLYADRFGHIGYQAPGLIPVRKQGDGRYPVPGWTDEYEWTGYIPFDALPSALDPASGYFVNANNAVTDPSYPYLITKAWGDGNRSQRITDLIKQGGKLDVAAMQRIQLDTYNVNAETLTPRLLAAQVGKDTEKARNLLRGWDFTQPADSAPAAYFNAVWRNLLRLMFTDKLTNGAPKVDVDGGGQWFEVVRGLLDRPDDEFWHNTTDPRGLRGRDAMLGAAMDDAAKELTDRLGADPGAWRWGELHRLTLKNQTLGTGPAPVQWLLNRGPYELGGGPATINAAGWNAKKGYDVNWVPSMRMVVDWANLDSSRWINLTGASGHAFDEHYDDQMPLWQRGESTAWAFGRDAVTAATKNHLTLKPPG
ncbi:penicillin acylase family protein [Amycolatopsis alba]|uniref:Penicillin acylase family protein n=1 Tax=Amycolatopsis alba DSM 44262 TaxID=1125972 RepID=A0A229REA0_AMYAL|nr:penicillin acylase family protein [Amycolatopsis alba]OXM45002.1 penicillin acylase family protein [Amycolatopsis alba DSM 44262]